MVACGLCFWQNHLLLQIANEPLPAGIKPFTLGVTEPFMQTLKISIYAGILISLPVLLYQAYAFLLPALKPTERRAVMPFLFLVPLLFIAGVVFSYFIVVPAATKFLLNYNQSEFNIQVRASSYYGFLITTLIALGLVFQVPMGIVAVTRLGHRDPRAALPQPSLRVPRPRGRGDAAPRNRPGDHADRARAAPGPVRVLADPVADVSARRPSAPARAEHRPPSRPAVPPARLPRCSSTFGASGGGSFRSSTRCSRRPF